MLPVQDLLINGRWSLLQRTGVQLPVSPAVIHVSRFMTMLAELQNLPIAGTVVHAHWSLSAAKLLYLPVTCIGASVNSAAAAAASSGPSSMQLILLVHMLQQARQAGQVRLSSVL